LQSIILLALGPVAAYLTLHPPQSTSLRKECTRDRCVYYQGSRRAFSVEKEQNTSRVVVRDSQRRAIVKVTEQDNGTIKVERTPR
jgi:hypothetical protein